MKQHKKRVLLKITGEIFFHDKNNNAFNTSFVHEIAQQIFQLKDSYLFGIVIGGGNLFRGGVARNDSIRPNTGHYIGMLATMINGLVLRDIFESHQLSIMLLSALTCPDIARPTSADAIKTALQNDQIIIFTGGTGNPFFTTDTSAVIRALQMDADEIWKGTLVDGVYDDDPRRNSAAHLIKKISYNNIIAQHLRIMDMSSYVLAQEHKKRIRVFNIFTPQALLLAAKNNDFGTIIE